MLSAKEEGINYQFLSFWLDLGLYLGPGAFGEHSKHYANWPYIYIYIYMESKYG